MTDEHVLKPRASAYFWWPTLLRLPLFVLIVVAAVLASWEYLGTPEWGLLTLVIPFLSIAQRAARLQKTSYTFQKDRMLRATGGLIGDEQAELLIRNITHVTVQKRWLKHALFGVGDLRIESAASDGTEMHLRDIPHPDKHFAYVERLMRENGFSLSGDLQQQEHPAKIAILLRFGGYLLVPFFLLGPMLALAALLLTLGTLGILLIVILGIILLRITLALLAQAANMLFLEYDVHSDMVRYRDGFLDKEESVLPAENLTDAEANQQFLEHLLGVYNVRISCQGSGGVDFIGMRRGKELEERVDAMLERQETQQDISKGAAKTVARKRDRTSTAELQQHKLRALLGPLVWIGILLLATLGAAAVFGIAGLAGALAGNLSILIFIGVIASGRVLEAVFTTYHIKHDSIESSYEFLATRRQEFSTENITLITFSRGVLDRITNTFTVRLLSLGAQKPLVMRAVPDSEEFRGQLLSKIGIDAEKTETIKTEYSALRGLAQSWESLLLTAALVLAPLLVGYALASAVIGALWALLWMLVIIIWGVRYRYAAITLADHWVSFGKGRLWRSDHYAPRDAIKHITSRRIPGSTAGTLSLDVGGFLSAEAQQQARGPASMTLGFLSDVFALHDRLDAWLEDAPREAVTEEHITDRPSVANTVVTYMIVFPLIVFLPLRVWYLLRTRYAAQSGRLLVEKGLVRRTRRTVARSNINHAAQHRGALNRIFKNATVRVFTVGTGTADLSFANAIRYGELYRDAQTTD